MALNEKQEKFAKAYADCGNASEAARQAGYSKKTAGVQAHKLLKHAEIAERIKHWKKQQDNEHELTLGWLRKELIECFYKAKAKGQYNAAAKFLDLAGRTIGAYTDRALVEHTGVGGTPLQIEVEYVKQVEVEVDAHEEPS